MINNTVYDYDKSSCSCYNCKEEENPTNFSLLNVESPKNRDRYNVINPSVIKKCDDPPIAVDARLISSLRGGQILSLDSNPKNSSLKLNEIYNSNLNNYKTGYKKYQDIKEGQILYYINKSQNPFYYPVFSNPDQVYNSLYEDPMGTFTSVYTRVPLSQHDNLENLSWINDSQKFRHDLMASQMSKTLKQKWTSCG